METSNQNGNHEDITTRLKEFFNATCLSYKITKNRNYLGFQRETKLNRIIIHQGRVVSGGGFCRASPGDAVFYCRPLETAYN